MKLLCRLGWHEYTKWKNDGEVIVKTIDESYRNDPHPETKTYEKQERECVHCGIKKRRRERK